MSDEIEDVDYMHPEGEKKQDQKAKNSEEKKNVEKAEEMTDLTEEIREEQKS